MPHGYFLANVQVKINRFFDSDYADYQEALKKLISESLRGKRIQQIFSRKAALQGSGLLISCGIAWIRTSNARLACLAPAPCRALPNDCLNSRNPGRRKGAVSRPKDLKI
jgi:hypothetical protein